MVNIEIKENIRQIKNEKIDIKNKARGITLISVVITIILLVILASVIINISMGEKGLLNKAKYAREEYLNAQIADEKNINDLYSELLIATNDNAQVII